MMSAPARLIASEMLERDRLTVEPTELRGGLHHRVLAAHVVRRDRNVEPGRGSSAITSR